MRSFIVKKNNFLKVATFGLLSVLGGMGLVCPIAAAENTQIGVSICGQNTPGVAITITEPTGDSVINQATTTFRGTVKNASQIEINVDGQYSSTLAIGANQTTFAIDISLEQGTHTVQMTANGICGGQEAFDSIVLTYTPAAEEPTNGTTTPTQVDQQPPKEKPTGTPPIPGSDIVQQIEQVPIIGGIVGSAYNFAAATGLSATITKTNGVAGVSRVVLTSVAITSVVMASSLAPAATSVVAQAAPGIAHTFSLTASRSLMYMGWVIRGIGALVMALAYFI
jgi:hypothetical protein